jgi:hypothetical protein
MRKWLESLSPLQFVFFILLLSFVTSLLVITIDTVFFQG